LILFFFLFLFLYYPDTVFFPQNSESLFFLLREREITLHTSHARAFSPKKNFTSFLFFLYVGYILSIITLKRCNTLGFDDNPNSTAPPLLDHLCFPSTYPVRAPRQSRIICPRISSSYVVHKFTRAASSRGRASSKSRFTDRSTAPLNTFAHWVSSWEAMWHSARACVRISESSPQGFYLFLIFFRETSKKLVLGTPEFLYWLDFQTYPHYG